MPPTWASRPRGLTTRRRWSSRRACRSRGTPRCDRRSRERSSAATRGQLAGESTGWSRSSAGRGTSIEGTRGTEAGFQSLLESAERAVEQAGLRQRWWPRIGASRRSTRCATKGRRGDGDGEGGAQEVEGGRRARRGSRVHAQGGRRAGGEGEPRPAKAVVARVSRRVTAGGESRRS